MIGRHTSYDGSNLIRLYIPDGRGGVHIETHEVGPLTQAEYIEKSNRILRGDKSQAITRIVKPT